MSSTTTKSLTAARKAVVEYRHLREVSLHKAWSGLFAFRDVQAVAQAEIEAHQRKTLTSARAVLRLFRKNRLKETFRKQKEERYRRSVAVVRAFRKRVLHRFDVFQKAGFCPCENELSDAIVSLLDPRGSHNLGILPLRTLLEEIRHRDRLRTQKILDALKQSAEGVRAYRELVEGTARVDIVIEADSFLIFIENKMRRGVETSHAEGPQTTRESHALAERGKRLGIPHEQQLGIFLSPQGMSAKTRGFIQLSTAELASALTRAVKQTEKCREKGAIEAFLDFYSWSS